MARKVLTTLGVARIRPPAKGRVEHPDALVPGLALRVTDKGSKSWTMRYRIGGNQRRYTLGPYGEPPAALGLDEARARAREALALVKAGADPAAPPQPEATAPPPDPDRITFGEVAREYIKREVPRLRRGGEVESIVRRRLLGEPNRRGEVEGENWGPRLWAEIKKRDAVRLCDGLVDAGQPAAAIRLHGIIRRLGRWAIRRDMVEVNPFDAMDRPAEAAPRARTLADDEIRLLWQAWDALGYPFGTLQQFLLVTGQRRWEVAELRLSEIDREARTWLLPAQRSKNGKAHLVPLSDMALAVLDGLPRFRPDAQGDHFLFSTTYGKSPVRGYSKAKLRTDKKLAEIVAELRAQGRRVDDVKPWRWHDLRRTCRTGLAALGVADSVAERVLNHADPSAMGKVYNVYDYAAEKRAALDAWAARLRAIVEPPPANVVPMGRRSA